MTDSALKAEGFRDDEIGTFEVYRAVGCERCNNGYRDREGIFQVMPMSELLGRAILEGKNAMELADLARGEGVIDLRQSGLLKVMQGITSLEEIGRVTTE